MGRDRIFTSLLGSALHGGEPRNRGTEGVRRSPQREGGVPACSGDRVPLPIRPAGGTRAPRGRWLSRPPTARGARALTAVFQHTSEKGAHSATPTTIAAAFPGEDFVFSGIQALDDGGSLISELLKEGILFWETRVSRNILLPSGKTRSGPARHSTAQHSSAQPTPNRLGPGQTAPAHFGCGCHHVLISVLRVALPGPRRSPLAAALV